MSKFRRKFFTLLIRLGLLSALLLAGAPVHSASVTFSNAKTALGDAGNLRKKAYGKQVYAPEILTTVGGVLFQSTAEPGVAIREMSFSSVESNGDAAIVNFLINGEKASYQIPAWMLVPIIDYVASPYNAVASLFGRPTEAELEKISGLMSGVYRNYLNESKALEREVRLFNRCVKQQEFGGNSRSRSSLRDEMLRLNPELASKMQALERLRREIENEADPYGGLLDPRRNRVGSLGDGMYFGGGQFDLGCEKYADGYGPARAAIERQKQRISELKEAATEEIKSFMAQFYLVDIHGALKNKPLGFRLLQADSLLMSMAYLEDVDIDGVPAQFQGEPLTPSNSGQPSIYDYSLARVWAECQAKHSDLGGGAWILTDVEEPITFSASGGQLVFDGQPYFYTWGRTNRQTLGGRKLGGKKIKEKTACTTAFKEFRPQFERYAPRVWRAVQKTARMAALLRFLKKRYPAEFRQLNESLRNDALLMKKGTQSFSTPRVWPKEANFN